MLRSFVMLTHALAIAPRRASITRRASILAATADDGSTRPWATFRVVFEDDEVIVCDKGSGLLAVPGRGDHKQDSLITRLRATRGASTTLAHRLDRDTSGLVVAAKTKRALRSLSMAFEAREVEKSYVGAVLGWPEATFGTVDEPIGKVKTDAGHNRVAVVAEADGGRRSRTNWALLEKRDDGSSLLSLQPVTGRSQQLRVHCALIGLPLLGDALHGTEEASGRAPRLCLHAARLSLDLPTAGPMTFEAEAPFAASADYASLLDPPR